MALLLLAGAAVYSFGPSRGDLVAWGQTVIFAPSFWNSSNSTSTWPSVENKTSQLPILHERARSSGDIVPFVLTYGYNGKAQCGEGRQPNRTAIEFYKGCPIPGLNNLLYTQHNRWYCAYRDNTAYELRDRTCNKGSNEPYRYSTLLQIKYEKLPPHKNRAAICWTDIKRQQEPPRCTWKDIPRFYGSAEWWEARRLIDFHQIYYKMAEKFVQKYLGAKPFLAVHMRRGDYYTHCVLIQRKGIKPWVTFTKTKGVRSGMSACYPTLQEVNETIHSLMAAANVSVAFVATNLPSELENFTASGRIVTVRPGRLRAVAGEGSGMRVLDTLILEMAVLSFGSFFLFNKYSSFSATVFEMAAIHNRTTSANVLVW